MHSCFQESLAQGVALFNAGRWFEAHEAWEEGWRQETGARRSLLQGLILVAAGCLKQEAGRFEGARTLFHRASQRLEALPATFEGVEVAALVLQVRHWRAGGAWERPMLAWQPPKEA